MKRIFVCLALWLVASSPVMAQTEDITRLVRSIVVQPGQTAGDAVCFGCSIRVLGTLQGDAITFAGEVEVQGTIQGDVVAIGGGIHAGSGARISGDVVAIGGNIERGAQASITGEVVSKPWSYLPGQRRLYLRGVLSLAGFHLVLLPVLFLVTRRLMERMAATLAQHSLWTLLVGLGVLGVSALLYDVAERFPRAETAVIYVVSAALVVTLLLGYTALGYFLGRRLARASGPFVALLAGAAFLFVLELIPVAGYLCFIVFVVLATGNAVLSGYGFRRGNPAAGSTRQES